MPLFGEDSKKKGGGGGRQNRAFKDTGIIERIA